MISSNAKRSQSKGRNLECNKRFRSAESDGLSTNWNVLDLINDHQVANGFQNTLDIGSCLLHILHGAFQTGMIKLGWNIGKILQALCKIFDELPARRDLYLREGRSEVFPMKFLLS